jgi:hypothetical protein
MPDAPSGAGNCTSEAVGPVIRGEAQTVESGMDRAIHALGMREVAAGDGKARSSSMPNVDAALP